MFRKRIVKPEKGNLYYVTKASGGYNPCIRGFPPDTDCDVLANCVGYAVGRFNEIIGKQNCAALASTNAENFYSVAKAQGLKTGDTPRVGAVMCWSKGKQGVSSDGAGHVAVVEEVISSTSVKTSESGYKAKKPFWVQTRKKGRGNWGQPNSYTFLGFIYNPAVPSISGKGIKKGDKGEMVVRLQKRLSEKGYLRASEIDGDFGKITLGAVLAFQFENGLELDGVAGNKTQTKLGGL